MSYCCLNVILTKKNTKLDARTIHCCRLCSLYSAHTTLRRVFNSISFQFFTILESVTSLSEYQCLSISVGSSLFLKHGYTKISYFLCDRDTKAKNISDSIKHDLRKNSLWEKKRRTFFFPIRGAILFLIYRDRSDKLSVVYR